MLKGIYNEMHVNGLIKSLPYEIEKDLEDIFHHLILMLELLERSIKIKNSPQGEFVKEEELRLSLTQEIMVSQVQN